MNQPDHVIGHGFAAGALLASLTGVLPIVLSVIGSLMAIAWYGVLFYDRFIKAKK